MLSKQWPLSGAIAAITFFTLVVVLALGLDGYSHVSQTVSEIGRQGSPAETQWRIGNLLVASSLLIFAGFLVSFANARQLSRLPGIFMSFFAISEAGMAIFATPHPLHNVFGLSALAGYMTPLVISLSWRGVAGLRSIAAVSGLAWLLVVAAILLNLSPLFAPSLYPLEFYGLVQRGLFVAFYGWCFYLSMALYRVGERRFGN